MRVVRACMQQLPHRPCKARRRRASLPPPHPQIVETEHLLKALLEQPNGLARRIIAKAGSEPSRLLERVDAHIRRQPRVSGDAAQQVLGRNLEGVVNAAMALRGKMGDSFVSVEHLVLALVDDARFVEGLFKSEGLTRAKLEAAVTEVRGANKVVDQDPEGKYEALSKYARDLTAAARDGKLDPVIGRDEEIRRAVQILSRCRFFIVVVGFMGFVGFRPNPLTGRPAGDDNC